MLPRHVFVYLFMFVRTFYVNLFDRCVLVDVFWIVVLMPSAYAWRLFRATFEVDFFGGTLENQMSLSRNKHLQGKALPVGLMNII